MTMTTPLSSITNKPNGIAGLNANGQFAGKIYKRCNVRDFGANESVVNGNLEAFNAAMASLPESGGEIIVDSMFDLSDTLIVNKQITFTGTNSAGGACGISVPANKTGIRFNNTQLSGTGTGADGAKLKDLYINCRDTQTTGHGIDIRAAEVTIDGCLIASFPQDGIHGYGNHQYQEGNANLWRVTNTQIVVCGGNGMFFEGPDANAGVAINVSVKNCSGWSFKDESKLGNTYIACHSAGSLLGDYRTNGTVSYSTFVGCYSETEAGVSQSSYYGPSTIIGGITATQGGTGVYSGVGTYYEGLNLNSTVKNGQNGRFHFRRDETEIASINEENCLEIFDGSFKCTHAESWTITEGVTTRKYFNETCAVDAVRFGNTNGVVGKIEMLANSVSYATSSDYRLKENVQPMVSALEKILTLNPVTFTWRASGDDGQGFIAHELQEVFPDAVTGEKDGDTMQGVDVSFIVPALVKALQELSAEIEILKSAR